jgi:hypothetical protein
MGRPVSPFIVERDSKLQRRKRRENGGKEEREKQKDGRSIVSSLFFSSGPLLVVRVMGTSVIPESCSSLEQREFPVNLDEAPHPMTGVGVK